jgi:uncharacterized protein
MEPAAGTDNKLKLSVDPRLVIAALMAVIAGMLLIWKPWASTSKADDQVVTVTGQAKISAQPDEFIFNPNYQFKNANKETALAQLTKKSDEIIAKLKQLGVSDNQIKSNSSGYEDRPYYPVSIEDNGIPVYSLQLTITVPTLDLAQKVQDYLVTTAPTGNVSPSASFSDNKRKELENQARDAATKDARAKAEQSAKNLGFKLGKVKSVNDGTGFGPMPYEGRAMVAEDLAKPQSLAVQPGQNDLHYSVTVSYLIR